jgi:RNA polymerase-binding transcription factor DksA
MTNNNEFDEIDVPIEAEEQAQLLEQRQRAEAIQRALSHYIVLDDISHPDDITEDLECEQCGSPVPAARVKALMAEFAVAEKKIWKADPNALICVECASANEKRKKQYRSGPEA